METPSADQPTKVPMRAALWDGRRSDDYLTVGACDVGRPLLAVSQYVDPLPVVCDVPDVDSFLLAI